MTLDDSGRNEYNAAKGMEKIELSLFVSHAKIDLAGARFFIVR